MNRMGSMKLLPLAMIVILVWAQGLMAQTPAVVGEATALRATVVGLLGPTTTALAATGNLANEADARAGSALTGAIPAVGTAEVLHAAAISSILGWNPLDRVSSEASLANLALTVAGNSISAAFAMAEAVVTVSGTSATRSRLESLRINGLPIVPNGTENQGISLPGITVVLNEVQRSGGVVTVNALHVRSLDGVVDVVVASATAGTRQ